MKEIPDNVIFVRHQDIVKKMGCSIIDLKATANIIAHALDNKFRGEITEK